MTVNDAIAALKKFDPKYVITKKYYAQPLSSFGGEAYDMKDLPTFDARLAYFYSLSAVKSEQQKKCEYMRVGLSRSEMVCSTEPHTTETVIVWVSPVPGQERVIAVQRKVPFEKEPLPAIASLKNGVFAKYPHDQAIYEKDEAAADTVEWAFDAQRRIISAASAKKRRHYTSNGELPSQADASSGIGLSVMLDPSNQNVGLATKMYIALFDGAALYKSSEQATATYKVLKAKADAADVNKSKGQNQTKF
ncbi:MAG: hypothetical protein P4L57_10275 [Rhizomicrobium sp.]|nr:hypothetical protein [Rhizomicrobium sp.]